MSGHRPRTRYCRNPRRGHGTVPPAHRHGYRYGRESGRIFWKDSAEPGRECRYRREKDRSGGRRGTHAGQCYHQSNYQPSDIFSKFVPLSKSLFNPKYPDHPITFGQHLRKARMDTGLQIKQLANASGLHEMTIINWEKDRTKPMPEKLANLAEIFEKCDCNDLSALN